MRGDADPLIHESKADITGPAWWSSRCVTEAASEVVKIISPVPDVDPVSAVQGDEEIYVADKCIYLNCKTLLDLEDQGFSHLLCLRDAITDLTAR